MENAARLEDQKTSKLFINIIPIAVPIAVVGLLALPNKLDLGNWTKNLSHVIGVATARWPRTVSSVMTSSTT